MSNFTGLHTALTGIRAGQRGIDTSANNIANVGSTGYTRQRAGYAPPCGLRRRGRREHDLARTP